MRLEITLTISETVLIPGLTARCAPTQTTNLGRVCKGERGEEGHCLLIPLQHILHPVQRVRPFCPVATPQNPGSSFLSQEAKEMHYSLTTVCAIKKQEGTN